MYRAKTLARRAKGAWPRPARELRSHDLEPELLGDGCRRLGVVLLLGWPGRLDARHAALREHPLEAPGIEALVWLTDIAGLSREEAVEVMRWSARALFEVATSDVSASSKLGPAHLRS
jgi:hypothetical protein